MPASRRIVRENEDEKAEFLRSADSAGAGPSLLRRPRGDHRQQEDDDDDDSGNGGDHVPDSAESTTHGARGVQGHTPATPNRVLVLRLARPLPEAHSVSPNAAPAPTSAPPQSQSTASSSGRASGLGGHGDGHPLADRDQPIVPLRPEALAGRSPLPTDQRVIRLPASDPDTGLCPLPPPWPRVPNLTQAEFDAIRRECDPVLDAMPPWSYYTIEERPDSQRDIPLPPAHGRDGTVTTSILYNIKYNIQFYRAKTGCLPKCPACKANFERYGVPRLGGNNTER